MNASVARALDALPEGLDPPLAELVPAAAASESATRAAATAELRRLSYTLAGRPLPQGRLHRGWILASLQARVAAGYFAAWIRCGLAQANERERILHETHLRAALRCLGSMTYLRGAVMKAGQLLANWPTLVPDEFAETLAALHFEAPPMHFALIEEVLRTELGATPESVFAEFDRQPFAAASLGQVHRAVTRDGERVAVKVQYPGIARSIRSDLANLSLALLPMRLTRNWESLREQLDDVAAVLALETDYEREAANQNAALELLTDLSDVVVPRVHRDLSTRRVLTTDLLDGPHLADYLSESPSAEARDRRGSQVIAVGLRMYFARICYADPHPGNFVFLRDGRLGLLDFGCCRPFDDAEWAVLALMDGALRRGGDAWQAGIRASLGLAPDESLSAEHERVLRAAADWMWEPLRHTGPFDFGAGDYVPRGVAAVRDLIRARATRSLPVFTWLQRSLIGIRSVTGRLGARVDMHSIYEREYARASG